MIYEFRYIELINGKKILLIDFADNEYDILSTFLESDVTPFEEWYKDTFDKVIYGQSPYEEVSGNICNAKIRPNKTQISDVFTGDAMKNCCEVDTKELRHLIDEWCDKVKEFSKK